MAFSATTIQPIAKANPHAAIGADIAPSILSMLILSAFAAKKGSRSMGKMKRQLAWTMLKYKATHPFAKRANGVSNRTLIYILIGVLFLVLLAISPLAALIAAIVLLIIILSRGGL